MGYIWAWNRSKKNISQLKNTFDYLIKHPKTSNEILSEFNDFKNDNIDLFTDNIKNFVYKTAHNVAASYANKNKSELIILGKLHLILKD